MATYSCNKCGQGLEEIGIPAHIQAVQMYGSVVNVGAPVPQEIKQDPFLYRGFFCPACKKAFCPTCSNKQGEICPQCNQKTLMPAYRPLLKSVEPSKEGVVEEAADATKSPIPSKPGPADGCCPHCGSFVLDAKGNVRIFLLQSVICCPKCEKPLDSAQLAALKSAGNSMPAEKLAQLAPAAKPPSAGAPEPAKKGACFVATAAFGSDMEPEVEFLRRFRDERLITNASGRLFIRVYNSIGPAFARLVRSSPGRRRVARAAIRLAIRPLQIAFSRTTNH